MSAVLALENRDNLLWLVDYWRGDWSFERDISEHRATMKGTARFRQSIQDNFLDYSEAGDLILQKTGQSFQATRRYVFECLKDSVTLFFDDGHNKGKVFQTLKLSSQSFSQSTLTGTHLCAKDRYNTAYAITDKDRFVIIHHVEGPAKNYTSTTLYFRSPLTV